MGIPFKKFKVTLLWFYSDFDAAQGQTNGTILCSSRSHKTFV